MVIRPLNAPFFCLIDSSVDNIPTSFISFPAILLILKQNKILYLLGKADICALNLEVKYMFLLYS